jgi:hypothetical protein
LFPESCWSISEFDAHRFRAALEAALVTFDAKLYTSYFCLKSDESLCDILQQISAIIMDKNHHKLRLNRPAFRIVVIPSGHLFREIYRVSTISSPNKHHGVEGLSVCHFNMHSLGLPRADAH